MKALFITVLAFVSAFLIYDRFIAPPDSRMVFENPPLTHDGKPSAGVIYSTPLPRRTSNSPAPLSVAPHAADFVPPVIASLESLTKNWTVLPPTAFPRQVRLRKPVKISMERGSSTLPAGSTAFAIGSQANILIIAPGETSQARGQISAHDTDLPAQIHESYERWKKGRVEAARLNWKQRQSATTSAVSMPGAVDSSGIPRRNTDGSYDLLLASMRSGQVTDIKFNKIHRWGTPQARTIDNLPTWTINVAYETIAFCGPLDTEAQAQVRDGKVIRWIYPGSGEPVP